jgi:hypothetical protein
VTKLEAYNLILAVAGEEPISDLGTRDYVVGLIGSTFETTKRRILAQGHAFNTDEIELSPDSAGEVRVPVGVMRLRFRAGFDDLTVRNGVVWDRAKAAPVATPVRVLATRDVPFEQVPEAFAHWIAHEIAADFRLRLSGVDSTTVYARQRATAAKAVALNSEPSNAAGATGWGAVVAAHLS